MKNRTPPLVLLLAVSAATSCTSPADSSPQAEIPDSAGVMIVYNRGPGWVEDQAWTVSSEPDLAIGVLLGPEEYQLVDVAAAARRSDGSLVVVDRGSRTVRLYGPRGTFLKTLGGPGSGPGEFMDPTALLVSAGDSVVVWDEALLRATRFDPHGELAGVETVDWGEVASRLNTGPMSKAGIPGANGKAAAAGLFPGRMEPLEDGWLLVRLVEKTGKAPPSGSHRLHSGALRVSKDLSVIDTLMFFGDTEQVSVDAPWGPFSVAPPLAKQTRTTHQGNPPKICVGDQEGPEIVCFGPGGKRTAIRWVHEPVPLTETEVAAWRDATVELYDLKLNRDQVLGMLDQVPRPEARPPYSTIILDQEGNLWAERGPTAGESKDSIDFLVFDLDGVLLGVVALPPIQVLEIGDDYVVGVRRDELEIQYVQLHGLRKHPNGAR
jgi:hypothetical protein